MKEEYKDKHLLLPASSLIELMRIAKDVPGVDGLSGAVTWIINQNKELKKENDRLKDRMKRESKVNAMARQIGRIEEELGGIYFHHHWQYCSPGASADLIDSANNFVNQKIKNSQEKKASKAVKERPQKPKQHQNIVDFCLQEDD